MRGILTYLLLNRVTAHVQNYFQNASTDMETDKNV